MSGWKRVQEEERRRASKGERLSNVVAEARHNRISSLAAAKEVADKEVIISTDEARQILSKQFYDRKPAEIDKLTSYLKDTMGFFQVLERAVVYQVATYIGFLVLEAEELVCTEGDPGDQFLLVFSGRLEVYKANLEEESDSEDELEDQGLDLAPSPQAPSKPAGESPGKTPGRGRATVFKGQQEAARESRFKGVAGAKGPGGALDMRRHTMTSSSSLEIEERARSELLARSRSNIVSPVMRRKLTSGMTPVDEAQHAAMARSLHRSSISPGRSSDLAVSFGSAPGSPGQTSPSGRGAASPSTPAEEPPAQTEEERRKEEERLEQEAHQQRLDEKLKKRQARIVDEFSNNSVGSGRTEPVIGTKKVQNEYGTKVASMMEGDGFGEAALLLNEPMRTATVLAETRTELLTVDRPTFTRFLRNAKGIIFQPATIRRILCLPPSQRSDGDITKLKALVSHMDVFAKIPQDLHVRLMKWMLYENRKPGDVICRQGDTGDAMYVILSGAANVHIFLDADKPSRKSMNAGAKGKKALGSRDKSTLTQLLQSGSAMVAKGHRARGTRLERQARGAPEDKRADDASLADGAYSKGLGGESDEEDVKTVYDEKAMVSEFGPVFKTMGTGEHFGELALLQPNSLRAATVIAKKQTAFIKITRQLYDSTIRQLQVEELQKKVKFLQGVSLFASLTNEELTRIVYVLKQEKCSRGKVVMEEGEDARHMYLVKDGEVRIMHRCGCRGLQAVVDHSGRSSHDVELALIGSSDCFGDEVAAGALEYRYTVVTSRECEFMRLDRHDLEKLTKDSQLRVAESVQQREAWRQSRIEAICSCGAPSALASARHTPGAPRRQDTSLGPHSPRSPLHQHTHVRHVRGARSAPSTPREQHRSSAATPPIPPRPSEPMPSARPSTSGTPRSPRLPTAPDDFFVIQDYTLPKAPPPSKADLVTLSGLENLSSAALTEVNNGTTKQLIIPREDTIRSAIGQIQAADGSAARLSADMLSSFQTDMRLVLQDVVEMSWNVNPQKALGMGPTHSSPGPRSPASPRPHIPAERHTSPGTVGVGSMRPAGAPHPPERSPQPPSGAASPRSPQVFAPQGAHAGPQTFDAWMPPRALTEQASPVPRLDLHHMMVGDHIPAPLLTPNKTMFSPSQMYKGTMKGYGMKGHTPWCVSKKSRSTVAGGFAAAASPIQDYHRSPRPQSPLHRDDYPAMGLVGAQVHPLATGRPFQLLGGK